ncbi:MAG TPA: hypothetical protein VHA82_09570 [Ramlibacter sp.]|uniref:hypothetical protein n=1 Tax=Ramlibacter sp. TaxID=1917967 RepID=UPI002C0F97D2|nr:hypothetical protein [Ramlibacter sp.]HVZ44048.1 hypothetical protein [Ramlibacter sp.]
MILSEAWLLAILLLALYIHDAVVLTGPAAAFLVRLPGGTWSVAFPTARFTLAGRHLFFPSQMPPATPVFALNWDGRENDDGLWQPELDASRLKPLSLISGFSFLLVLVALPLALLTHQATFVVVLAIGCAYLSVFASITVLWLARSRLGLSQRFCANLTFEMLLCPPVAANLVRRVSLSLAIESHFITLARRLAAPGRWSEARDELARRIDIQLEAVEPGSVEDSSLRRVREQLI